MSNHSDMQKALATDDGELRDQYEATSGRPMTVDEMAAAERPVGPDVPNEGHPWPPKPTNPFPHSSVHASGSVNVRTVREDRDVYAQMGEALGSLVAEKQRQYGHSTEKSAGLLGILYPDGLKRRQYQDALLMVRVLDKLSRIAQRGEDGVDLGAETPWKDIAGYGLLGWEQDG